MRHIIRKMFFVWEFEKEEAWLNEMAARGLCLIAAGFGKYEFEDCTPGEYTVRMELLSQKPSHVESKKYIEFLEETGAEQVGVFSNWVYFRKKTADGSFELFSDLDSRIRHMKRIVSLISWAVYANVFIGVFNLAMFFISLAQGAGPSWPNLLCMVNLALGIGALGASAASEK